MAYKVTIKYLITILEVLHIILCSILNARCKHLYHETVIIVIRLTQSLKLNFPHEITAIVIYLYM